MFKYTVILLNYFTNSDLKNAVQSIKDTANDMNFNIVVVNVNENGKNHLQLSDADVKVINILENKGFAFGNNIGLQYVVQHNMSKYTVIMNPDTIITSSGTIDRLIHSIEKQRIKDPDIVGGQPEIITINSRALSIRKVYTYFDSLVQVFFPLRLIFRKRYENMWRKDIYFNDRKSGTTYEVPAGNFFIIDTNIFFNKINGFDTATFLYEEEMILGFKLQKLGLHLWFNPNERVFHEQGKSTQSHEHLSYFAFKHMKKSKNVYLKKYLKVGMLRIIVLDLLFSINFTFMKLIKK